LHESVDVAVLPAGGVTLAGVREHVRPAGLTEEVRATAWLNVPTEVTVIADVPATPAFTVTEVGLAESVKSADVLIVTVMIVELVMSLLVPPVPRIVTV
jgi:hypothetical protein